MSSGCGSVVEFMAVLPVSSASGAQIARRGFVTASQLRASRMEARARDTTARLATSDRPSPIRDDPVRCAARGERHGDPARERERSHRVGCRAQVGASDSNGFCGGRRRAARTRLEPGSVDATMPDVAHQQVHRHPVEPAHWVSRPVSTANLGDEPGGRLLDEVLGECSVAGPRGEPPGQGSANSANTPATKRSASVAEPLCSARAGRSTPFMTARPRCRAGGPARPGR